MDDMANIAWAEKLLLVINTLNMVSDDNQVFLLLLFTRIVMKTDGNANDHNIMSSLSSHKTSFSFHTLPRYNNSSTISVCSFFFNFNFNFN